MWFWSFAVVFVLLVHFLTNISLAYILIADGMYFIQPSRHDSWSVDCANGGSSVVQWSDWHKKPNQQFELVQLSDEWYHIKCGDSHKCFERTSGNWVVAKNCDSAKDGQKFKFLEFSANGEEYAIVNKFDRALAVIEIRRGNDNSGEQLHLSTANFNNEQLKRFRIMPLSLPEAELEYYMNPARHDSWSVDCAAGSSSVIQFSTWHRRSNQRFEIGKNAGSNDLYHIKCVDSNKCWYSSPSWVKDGTCDSSLSKQQFKILRHDGTALQPIFVIVNELNDAFVEIRSTDDNSGEQLHLSGSQNNDYSGPSSFQKFVVQRKHLPDGLYYMKPASHSTWSVDCDVGSSKVIQLNDWHKRPNQQFEIERVSASGDWYQIKCVDSDKCWYSTPSWISDTSCNSNDDHQMFKFLPYADHQFLIVNKYDNKIVEIRPNDDNSGEQLHLTSSGDSLKKRFVMLPTSSLFNKEPQYDPWCQLEDIIQAQSKTACTEIKIAVYENPSGVDTKVLMQAGLHLTETIAGAAEMVPVAIAAATMYELLNVFDDSGHSAEVKFQDAVNDAIEQIGECIDETAIVTLTNVQMTDLVGYMSTFARLANQDLWSSVVDWDDDCDDLIGDLKAFQVRNFGTSAIDLLNGKTQFDSLQEQIIFLPVFRASVNLFSRVIIAYMLHLKIQCQAGELSDIENLNPCDKFENLRQTQIPSDLDVMTNWAQKAYDDIVASLRPTNLVASSTCSVTQRKYSRYIEKVENGALKGTTKGDGNLVSQLYTEVTIKTQLSTTVCKSAIVRCDTHLSNSNVELLSTQCCDGLQQVSAAERNSLTSQINDWSANFDQLYLSPIVDFQDAVSNALLWDGFIVLSVDHNVGSTGKYFNFYRNAVDVLLGRDDWHGQNFRVYDHRTKQALQVKMWRGSNGGSLGDGHGRKSYGAAARDWQVGYTITFVTGKFKVLSVDHSWFPSKDGKYFNFMAYNVDAILGRTDWSSEKFSISNSRTGETLRVILWRTSYGSVGNGHGRKNVGAKKSDWRVGDILTLNI